MSGNHNQSLARALDIVDSAAAHGADAIKLQTYTAETMTLNVRMPGFVIDDPQSPWGGRQLYELYEEAHTPWEWHRPIMARAAALGMHCFSTPFDASAVEFLESLSVPAYKIASFENTDLPLLRRVAATGKPMIISTGMATAGEIDEAVSAVREAGCRDLVLLKCTSTYPATAENTNIATIAHIRNLFNCEVGLSDHTLGCGVAVAATALGATVIEKHFTLCRADGGVDSAFSMEPHELRQLRDETERAWQAVGEVRYGPTESEIKSLNFRRSLYIAQDVKAGETLTRENMRSVRPGFGLSAAYFDKVLGLKVQHDAACGTPVTWDLLR
jgi:N-acetylneuraminate synthase